MKEAQRRIQHGHRAWLVTASGLSILPIGAEVLGAEVRRARFGPGPRPQARWVGRGLRRSRAGPEDRFCEAVRNDLRVPLMLEGPTRTMRAAPVLVLSYV